MAGAPWKLGWLQRLLVWVEVLGGLGFLAIGVAWMVVEWARQDAGWRSSQAYFLFTASSLGVAGVAATIAPILNWLSFTPRWTDPQRLEELALTTLSPREIAFGLAWWPTVTGLIAPFCALATAYTAFALAVGREFWDRRSDFDTEFIPFIIVFVIVSIAAVLGISVVTVRCWFFLRRKWLLIFAVPAACGIYWGAAWGLILPGIFTVEELLNGSSARAVGYLLVIGLPCVLLLVDATRNAGRFAPSRLLAPVLPHVYEEASAIGRWGAVRRDLERRAAVGLGLRLHLPIPWRSARLPALVAVAAAVILFSIFDAKTGDRSWRGVNIFFAQFALAATGVFVNHREMARRGFSRIPIVGGGPVESLLRVNLPAIAVFGAIVFAATFADIGSSVNWTGYRPLEAAVQAAFIAGCATLGGALLHLVAMAFVASCGEGTRLALFLYPLAPLGLWLWAGATLHERTYGRELRFFLIENDPSPAIIAGFALATAVVYFSFAALQRLHTRRLLGVADGDVTPAAPETDIEQPPC